MRPYEVVIIFDADLEEETIRSVVDRSVEHVRASGGAPGTVDHWGKRRFAYELKHRREGYYVILRAEAETQAVEDLGRSLSLADEVLRHRIVRIPEGEYHQAAPEAASTET